MIIKPAKPASGYAIRHAFRYAATEMLGDKYGSSHEMREGVCVDFSAQAESPTQTPLYGESIRIRRAEGRSVRITLAPINDVELYKEFYIVAEDGYRGSEFNEFKDFETELLQLATLINKRLELWISD